MPDIRDWSTTPADNATAGSINWAEGQPPSTVNDSARQMMADERGQWNDGGWFVWGDTHTFASSTATTTTGDQRTTYLVNRRIRAVGTTTGTIYGTVSAVTYSANTAISYTWDSGSLTNETLTIAVGYISPTGKPIDINAIANFTAFTGGTLSQSLVMQAPVIMDGSRIDEDSTATLSATATLDLSTVAGNYVPTTGTGEIANLGSASAGIERVVKFGAVNTLSSSANLILPGSAAVVTAAGDVAAFRSEGSGVWRMASYLHASGLTPFTKYYDSGGIGITSAGSVGPLSHGLGGVARGMTVFLRCLSAASGYSVGDEVPINPNTNTAGGNTNQGVSIINGSSGFTIKFGAATNVFLIIAADTGNTASQTNSNWEMVIRAWR